MIRQPRQVKLKTIIEVFKKRPALLRIGTLFMIIPIPVLLIFSLVFSLLEQDVPKVDYEQINKLGIVTIGTVTNIETQYNITINNQHPSIISYNYLANGNLMESKFKSLSPDKINRMQIGDTIQIKHLNGEAIITSLAPFEFPLEIFLIVPLTFFLIGLPFVLLLVRACHNEIQLYKFGSVVNAEIIFVAYKAGLPFTKAGQGIQVHYRYTAHDNQTHLGESFTKDLSLLNTLKQGDLVKIFVSPDDKSKSTLIPMLEALRNNWQIE